MARRPHRVIVIGAGMSGLACANELVHRGYDVLVVEARSRVGGRLKGADILLSNDESVPVDLGGALIHGVDENPIAVLASELGVATKPVSDTLLLEKTGWPVDPKEDEKVYALFNDCLEATFQKAEGSQSTSSFGELFEQVCRERHVNPTPLLRWHQANLEVSCGASFDDLGWQWNEDEPYGFDGEHLAVKTSWRSVVEPLAEKLNILYNSPVQRIHIAHAKKSSRSAESSENKQRVSTRERKKPEPLAVPPPRQSRRLRGEEASSGRRSQRQSKGKGVDMFTVTHDDSNGLRKRPRAEAVDTPGPKRSVVQVSLTNGTILEAHSVVSCLPLGILKSDTVEFDPPLPEQKLKAIDRLGAGLLNKCAVSFPNVFWQETDFMGLAGEDHSYLILNGAMYTGNPVLLFMFGGSFAFEIEDWTDEEIVDDCLRVLKSICSDHIPDPVDYHVTRWGHEEYSRMAFTYIPPGIDGMDELKAMSQPIVDEESGVPLIMFAGEHTTPYHPSTIHGAYLSGIREASRLEIALNPEGNEAFADDELYQRSFHLNGSEAGEREGQRLLPSKIVSSHSKDDGERQRHRRRGASNVMKRVDSLGTSNKQSASRRVQRTAQTKVEDPAHSDNGKSHQNTDRITRQEERALLRSVESYGRDFGYIRDFVFPVYGGDEETQPLVSALRERHRTLLQNNKERKAPPTSWKTWLAKYDYASNQPVRTPAKKKTQTAGRLSSEAVPRRIIAPAVGPRGRLNRDERDTAGNRRSKRHARKSWSRS